MSGSWRERDDPENRACEISLARLSPRLLRRRDFMRHLFVVGSLDKHIQNEKELILPRRLCLRRELPEPGARNYACGANCPYQALKGGYFLFVWGVGTRLDLTWGGQRHIHAPEHPISISIIPSSFECYAARCCF